MIRDSLKAIFFFFLCAFWFMTQGTLYAQNQESSVDKIRVAVLDFEGKGISQMEASTLTDRLRSYLVASGSFLVIERGKMNEILGEQNFQLSGCVSSECAVEVGQLLGVSRMITGGIGKIGKTFTLDVRVIDIETSQIIESVQLDYTGEIDGLLSEIRKIAFRLSGKEVKPTPPPIIATPTPLPTPPKVEEALAHLTLVTVPIGATVYIDGIKLGLTPTNLGEVRAGKHSLRFTKSGYIDKETDITIEPGESKVVTVNLDRINVIDIASNPKGAAVFINEELKGISPVKVNLVSGTYMFSLFLEGYEKWETTVIVNQDWKYDVKLLKLVQVNFLSEPIDAEVYMNNKFIGRTPTLTTIPEGRYLIIFRKENYKAVVQEKDIHKETTVNAKMNMTNEYKKLLAFQSGKKSLPWFKIMGGAVLAGGAAAAALILGGAAEEPPIGGNGGDDTDIGAPPAPPN